MILSDADILARLETGDLRIDPLSDPELQVQPASVDLRLGTEFLEFQRANISCIHPNRADEVDEYVESTHVPEGDEFVLHPGDFVLGSTKERVAVPDDLVAHVEGRSSLGRLAVVIHASLPTDEEVFLWTPDEGFGFYEIGDIVENERSARAVSFDPQTLRVRTHQVSDHIRNPTKRIYRVTLESGREVSVTRDHNLFTLDEYGGVTRIASEDAEGTLVMVPDRLPEPSAPQTEIDLVELFGPGDDDITVFAADGLGEVDWSDVSNGVRRHYEGRSSAPMSATRPSSLPSAAEMAFKQSDVRLPRTLPVTTDLAWALGFYVAEGYRRRKQIVVSNTNREYLERFASVFEPSGAGCSWYERDNGVTILTVCSALWSKVFGELAGEGSEKTVPAQAWDWSNEVLTALYEGLIDGDGHRREGRDTLYTANGDLASRAMFLGARLGLLNSVYPREREQYLEMSDVTNESEEWAVDFSQSGHKRGQYVPTPSALLRRYRDRAALTMADAAAEMGYSSPSSVSNVENEEWRSTKRETLCRFRDLYRDYGVDTTRLDQILDSDVRFERVESVETTDRVEPTYDLEVQPNGRAVENFIGGRGGVFLSNTAGLCDPGYQGQITLELSNLGTAPVALTPGMRISQVTFTRLSSPAERPYGTERGSKYQGQTGPQASRIGSDPEFAERREE